VLQRKASLRIDSFDNDDTNHNKHFKPSHYNVKVIEKTENGKKTMSVISTTQQSRTKLSRLRLAMMDELKQMNIDAMIEINCQ
jgi:hypothetical protein